MNFKAKSIKMPGQRQRADAYRGVDLRTAKHRQGYPMDHSGGGGGERIVSLTRKSSVKQKRPEMRACVSRPSPAPSFAVHPLAGQP